MTLSSFALMIAVLELTVGLPLLVAPARAAAWLMKLIQDDLLYRCVGALTLILCVLVLAEDASLEVSIAGLVRLVAWIGAIKSLAICWWPGLPRRKAEQLLATGAGQRVFGVLATAAGALFVAAWVALG